eukprot:Skav223642  [mRNA]  locus=scaffold46:596082:599876:- [translate_table: standard]
MDVDNRIASRCETWPFVGVGAHGQPDELFMKPADGPQCDAHRVAGVEHSSAGFLPGSMAIYGGRGACGDVCSAQDKLSEDTVAIKKIEVPSTTSLPSERCTS